MMDSSCEEFSTLASQVWRWFGYRRSRENSQLASFCKHWSAKVDAGRPATTVLQ